MKTIRFSKMLFLIRIFILLLVFLGAGCTKKNLFVAEKKVDSNLKVAFVGTPELDWVSASSTNEQLTSLIQDPLLDLQITTGKLQFVPRIVSKWVFTSPTSLHLELDKETRWSNGSPLTSTQLINSWKELLMAYNSNSNSTLLFCISNAKNFAERRVSFSSVGIQSQNSSSIDLKFQSPCPHFPFLLTHLALSPRLNYPWSVESGHFIPRLLDSLGAWNLESHWPQNEVFLKQNALHQSKESPSRLSKIQVSFFSQLKEPFQLLEDKQVDVVVGKNIYAPMGVPAITSYSSLDSVILVFNPYKKPFQTSRAREIFIRSIEKEELLRLSGNALEDAARLLPFLNGEIKKTEFSVEFAKKSLAELKSAGITLSMAKDPLLSEIAKNLQAQWKKNLGLDVEVIQNSLQDAPMISLQRFRPDFYKKALGLEEWAKFSSSDFLSPLLSNLSLEKAVEPFKLYEDRLIKMEKWIIEEEKLVFPLVSLKKIAFLRSGVTGLQYYPVRDVFGFDGVEKN